MGREIVPRAQIGGRGLSETGDLSGLAGKDPVDKIVVILGCESEAVREGA